VVAKYPKIMGISFKASEKAQTLEEYNEDVAAGNAEIERGDSITAENLKTQASTW
jgi:hypothetical protein